MRAATETRAPTGNGGTASEVMAGASKMYSLDRSQ
eukprot:CAMPEP_0194327688 /NCGR_PEP_ID=MMETSP0171-20130528/42120_1 /TAXON_ID=218684 /ORGANISM="Corethron pennatum, Strain L29A3" /LENGTH=34 /DNA_ID= /DNA_START= /DNA_END= /DNA_ORIENTATION=